MNLSGYNTLNHKLSPLALGMSSKDPALQAYLASKYLSGAKAEAIIAKHGSSADGLKRKKKKRKVEDGGIVIGASGGMRIADDDGGWAASKEDERDDEVPGEHCSLRVRNDSVVPGCANWVGLVDSCD